VKPLADETLMTNSSAIMNSFLLSLVAGLGTSLGGLLAAIRKPGKRPLGCFMWLPPKAFH